MEGKGTHPGAGRDEGRLLQWLPFRTTWKASISYRYQGCTLPSSHWMRISDRGLRVYRFKKLPWVILMSSECQPTVLGKPAGSIVWDGLWPLKKSTCISSTSWASGLFSGSLAHGSRQNSAQLAQEAITSLILAPLPCKLYLTGLTCQQLLCFTHNICFNT